MAAAMLQGEITFFSEAKGDKIIFVAEKRESVEVGSDLSCDIRIEDADHLHMRIQLDTETGKVKASNLSAEHPILVNGDVVNDKKLIKSGDVITVLNHTMRWDSKEYLRRRTAALTKSARKEIKHRVVRTNKRITIHNLASTKQTECEESDEEKQADETTPPQVEKDVSKLNALNLSGTLITSFTPQKVNSPRSYTRTPVKNTPVENVENSNGNAGFSPRLSKSMHLIDLTTPAAKRVRTPSAPPSLPASTTKRTPLSVKTASVSRAAVVKNDTLLMSAIKNSSIKKRLNESLPITSSTVKGKVLFAPSPILDESNASSSVVSVSFCSAAEEEEEEVSMVVNQEEDDDDNNIAENEPISDGTDKSQTESSEQTSDEETKALLDRISFVIEQDEIQNEANGGKSLLTIEEKFQKIHADITPNQLTSQSVLHINTPERELADEEFENIVESAGDDSHKKAETLLTWIETARESLVSNNTEQVLSSRYSNITPNDSIVTANPATTYDVKTPKISILDIRNSEGFSVSPVTRLSINDNSTVVVENYKLNSDIPKSLRSTRKRIGNAMASLHDTSQADTTLDMNESMNASINLQKNNTSILETTTNNILSLDDPQDQDHQENEDGMNAENIAPQTMTSNNYIAFAEHYNDEEDGQSGIVNNDEEKEFFEISNSDVAEEEENDDKSSVSSVDEAMEVDEDVIEEIFSSQDNEMTPKIVKEKIHHRLSSAIKFRLSEQDLEEDGINPLDISSRTEDDAVLASQESIPTQRDSDIPEEDVDIPATQNVEEDLPENENDESEDNNIFPSDEFTTQEMNDIMEGKGGSIGFICNAQTDEVESMIEEHLESPITAAAATTMIAPDKIDFVQSQVKSEEKIPCSQGSELSNDDEEEIVEIYSSSQGSELSEKSEKGSNNVNIKPEACIQEEEEENLISDDESMTAEQQSVKNEPVITEPENEVALNEILEPLKETEISRSQDIFADINYSQNPNQIFDSQPEAMAADIIEEEKDDDIWETVGTSENHDKTPSEENIAAKKDVTVSEENEAQEKVIETPSRRRGPRINYANLATGSPAKTPVRRGRSASIEVETKEIAQTPKHNARSARKVMEPIVEDSVALKISVHVEESPDTFEIEVSSEPPDPDEIPSSQQDMAKENSLESVESDENTAEKIDLLIEEKQGDEISEMADDQPINLPAAENVQDENDFEDLKPVVEEPCIKKVAYVTTNDDENQSDAAKNHDEGIIAKDCEKVEEVAAKYLEAHKKTTSEEPPNETPSRRRGPRINYADLAAGSPTKTPVRRRGRSASIEEPTPTPKRVRSTRKVMDPIVEMPSTSQASASASVELFDDKSSDKVFEKKTPRKRNQEATSSGSSKTPRRDRSSSKEALIFTQQKSPKRIVDPDSKLVSNGLGGVTRMSEETQKYISFEERTKYLPYFDSDEELSEEDRNELVKHIADKKDYYDYLKSTEQEGNNFIVTDPIRHEQEARFRSFDKKMEEKRVAKIAKIVESERAEKDQVNNFEPSGISTQESVNRADMFKLVESAQQPQIENRKMEKKELEVAQKMQANSPQAVIRITPLPRIYDNYGDEGGDEEKAKIPKRTATRSASVQTDDLSAPTEEPIVRKARGRKARVVKNSDSEEEPTPAKKKQTKKVDSEQEKESVPVKRGGRRAAKATPEELSKNSEPEKVQEPEKIDEPLKRGRRAAKVVAEEKVQRPKQDKSAEKKVEPVKSRRGRPAAKAIEEEIENPEPEKTNEPEKVKEPVKSRRGNKAAKVDEVAETPEPEKIKEPVKSRRGRQAAKAIEEEIDASESEKPTEKEKEEEPVIVKKGRGRQAKVVAVEVPTPQPSPAVSESKRGGRRQKDEEKIETEASTTSSAKGGRRGGKKVVEKEEEKVAPAKKGRRENAQIVPEETLSKRTRRGVKAVGAEIIEIQSSPEEAKQTRAATPKPKKRALKKVTIMTPASMETMMRKQKIVEPPPEAATSSRKRQAPIEVSEEPVVKRATRGKKK